MSSWLPAIAVSFVALAADREVVLDGQENKESEGRVVAADPGETARRDAAVQAAFERGVSWLASRQAQNLDGSMPVATTNNGVRVPIAATALGALALMAAGNEYGRGPYGENVARAVDYLLGHVELDTDAPDHGFIGRRSAPAAVKMHSHGFATLALAQAYSTSPRTAVGESLRRSLTAAVRLIERTQGREGAWFYGPERLLQHEGSVTICLVAALRAARDAGIVVDVDVIRRAQEYVKRSQLENGLFAYELGDPEAHTSVALTAAAVSTLYSLGEYASEVVDIGIDAIWRELALRDSEDKTPRFPHYERLYLAQAFWQNTDPTHFERWSETEFRNVLADQEPDGRWLDAQYGDGYATAINCLVISMSEGLLPVFQR